MSESVKAPETKAPAKKTQAVTEAKTEAVLYVGPTISGIKAFRGEMGNEHKGIFQREGSARLPIKQLYSNSIPKMIGNEEKVYGVVKPSIDRNLQHYVEQQIELLTK